jgi:hypothetical protein
VSSIDSFEPTTAERARTVVAAAASLTMSTRTRRQVLVGLHTLDQEDGVVLRMPSACQTAADMGRSAGTSPPTVLEFTDVAPTPVRDRVRARVSVSGPLIALPSRESAEVVDLRLTPEQITFEATGGTVAVHPDEFAAAETDPLAASEADLLIHLADAHPDLVTRLTHLIEPRLLHHLTRVLPLAMDRYGITLRLERTRHHCDVRLPFPARLSDVTQTGDRVRALLAEAAARCHRRRLHARR